jgi:hypothetical protein
MDDAVWHMVAKVDIPELKIRGGDILRFNPALGPLPWTIGRRADLNFGAVLNQMNLGALEAVDITPSFAIEELTRRAGPPARILPLRPRPQQSAG